jgi:hypothetical protein
VEFAEFKKFFIYTLIFSLIICASVAVVAVLMGEFTDTLGKVLGTLGMIVIHTLIALIFIWDNKKQGTFGSFNFFTNTIFFLIIVSFLTSIFGIWEIFNVLFDWRFLQVLFYSCFCRTTWKYIA